MLRRFDRRTDRRADRRAERRAEHRDDLRDGLRADRRADRRTDRRAERRADLRAERRADRRAALRADRPADERVRRRDVCRAERRADRGDKEVVFPAPWTKAPSNVRINSHCGSCALVMAAILVFHPPEFRLRADLRAERWAGRRADRRTYSWWFGLSTAFLSSYTPCP